jgi:hypothetical protein
VQESPPLCLVCLLSVSCYCSGVFVLNGTGKEIIAPAGPGRQHVAVTQDVLAVRGSVAFIRLAGIAGLRCVGLVLPATTSCYPLCMFVQLVQYGTLRRASPSAGCRAPVLLSRANSQITANESIRRACPTSAYFAPAVLSCDFCRLLASRRQSATSA